MRDDEVLLIDIRSSVGIKKGIALSNTLGVIDSDSMLIRQMTVKL